MEKSENNTEDYIQEARDSVSETRKKYKQRIFKREQKMVEMRLAMKAHGVFGSILVLLRYQGINILGFGFLSIIMFGIFGGLLAKIIWTIWQTIFSINL